MSVIEEVRLTEVEASPVRIWVDSGDDPMDVMEALALSPFAQGDQPWAMWTNLERVRSEAPLMPAEARLTRAGMEHEGVESRLACGDGWTLRVILRRDRTASVQVTAETEELARRVLEETIRDATEPPPKAEHIDMGFWWRSPHGPRRSQKPITSSPWKSISGNYPSGARAELERLIAVTPDERMGRLLLLHGPPGTGKTTMLRTLAREWDSWCQTDCVLDPENLFAEPGYLMEVAMGPESRGAKRRWRLLVLEDCDELIRAGAKRETGQGLSRLLNLTDGLLGQGRDVLVAITTNEDISLLHPAVTRPGRCLARIEVGRLSQEEALAWLASSSVPRQNDGTPRNGNAAAAPSLAELTRLVPARGATLAELYALSSGQAVSPAPEAEDTGLYL